MKKIKNEKCKHIVVKPNASGSTYSDLIDYCIRQVPASALNGNLIASIVKISAQLGKGDIEMDDEDYKVMKQLVKSSSWGTPGQMMPLETLKEIDKFITDVCSMD